MIDVGHSVRIALAMHNKSNKWLAEKLGVTLQTAGYHRRTAKQNYESIEKLAAVFDMPVSEFLALSEVREKD